MFSAKIMIFKQIMALCKYKITKKPKTVGPAMRGRADG